VDHHFDDHNRLTLRYLLSRGNNYPVTDYPEAPAQPGAYGLGHVQYVYGSWTRILGPIQVNDLRYTYVNRVGHSVSRGVGGNYPEKLGLTGVDQRAFPSFAPSGFVSVGSNSQERRRYPIEQHQIIENFTRLRGHHFWKFG